MVFTDVIAPWILESWVEAIERLVFSLPQVSVAPAERAALLGIATILAFLVVAGAVSGFPARARATVRLLAAVPFMTLPALTALRHAEEARWFGYAAEVASLSPVTIAWPEPESRPPPVPPVAAPAPPTLRTEPDTTATAAAPSGLSAPASSTPPIEAPAPVLEARQPEPPKSETPPARVDAEASIGPVAVATREAAPEVAGPAYPQSSPAPPAEQQPSSASTALAYLNGILGADGSKPDVNGTKRERVELLFASNRAAVGGAANPSFGAGRSEQLTLGRATLMLPRSSAAPRSASQNVEAARAEIENLAHLGTTELATAATSQIQAASAVRDRVLVIVPGFDTGFEAALSGAAELTRRIGYDGAILVFSWPSAGNPRDYRADADNAAASAPHLARLLALLTAQTHARSLDILAVGLGARTAVDALLSNAAVGKPRVEEVALVAPDMDRHALTTAARTLTSTVKRITLYASASDRALNVTRRYAGAVPRAGDVPEDGPLIVPAVATVDMSRAGTDALAALSGGRVAGDVLVAHLKALLSGGGFDGAGRLEKVETARGVYWKHPG